VLIRLNFVFVGSRRRLVDFSKMVEADRVFLREGYRGQELSILSPEFALISNLGEDKRH